MSDLGTLLDSLTFGVFDFDDTYDRPSGTSSYSYNPFKEETDIISLLGDDFRELAGQDLSGIATKRDQYYDMLMSGDFISDEEMADFDTQYQAEIDALTEKYNVQFERHGAARMADLVSRGVLETTTGSDILSQDQETYSSALTEGVSGILQEKELAKMDFADRKRAMAQQGYNLTSGIMQQRQSNLLATAGLLQNFSTGQRVHKLATQLDNMLRDQQWEQYKHKQRNDDLGTTLGIISEFL